MSDQPLKTARDWSRETVDSETFPHLNDENRVQAILIIEQALTAYLLQESGELVKVVEQYIKYFDCGCIETSPDSDDSDKARQALNNYRSRHK